MREFEEQGGIGFLNYIFFTEGMNFTTCHFFHLERILGADAAGRTKEFIHMRKWIKRGASKATGIY